MHLKLYILHRFHIFVVYEYRNFKFGVQVDHGKSHPTEDKLSMKGAWSSHMTHFNFVVPLKYPQKEYATDFKFFTLVGHVQYQPSD